MNGVLTLFVSVLVLNFGLGDITKKAKEMNKKLDDAQKKYDDAKKKIKDVKKDIKEKKDKMNKDLEDIKNVKNKIKSAVNEDNESDYDCESPEKKNGKRLSTKEDGNDVINDKKWESIKNKMTLKRFKNLMTQSIEMRKKIQQLNNEKKFIICTNASLN